MAAPTPHDPTPAISDWLELSSTDALQPATLAKGTLRADDTYLRGDTIPPTTAPLVPGYEILGELGRGGMGVVFKARQVGLNRLVALKMILTGAQSRPEDLLRFRAEAEAVAQLQHPHIVQVYDIGDLHGLPFFSLEYVDGGSLDRLLDRQPQPPAFAAALVEKLASAIQVAHERGIIHRDLKPANVLLSFSRAPQARASEKLTSASEEEEARAFGARLNDCVPKITDFGLAKRLAMDSGHTRTGEIVGTPSYMAPEQAAGQVREIGPAVDIYALGGILYEMLTGRPPFKGLTPMETVLQVISMDPVSPRRLMPQLPVDLETICLKCLHKEPNQRYATAQDLAEDLRRFQDGLPIQARPLGWVERTGRWCRRNPVVAGLLTAVLVLLIAGTVVSTFFAVQASRQAEEALTEKKRADQEASDALQEKKRADAKTADALREKQRADENFARARRAVKEYLDTVAKEQRLREGDFFLLRKKLLTTALPLLQELSAQARNDTMLVADRLDALGLLVDIQGKVGDLPAAITAAREFIALLQQELAKAPDNPQLRERLVVAHINLGQYLQEQGQTREAEKVLRQGMALAQEMIQRQIGDGPLALARMQVTLAATLHDLNQAAEAEKLVRAAIATLRARSQAAPQDRGLAEELSHAQTTLGTHLIKQGRLADAEKEYLAARRYWEELSKGGSGESLWARSEQAGLTYQLSRLYNDQGRWADAERESLACLRPLEQLVRDFPSISRYRVLLGLCRTNYAMILEHTRRVKEAREQLLLARDLLEPLAPEGGPDLKARQELARVYHFLGGMAMNSNQRPEAEQHFRRARDILQGLTKQHPGLAELRHELAAVHLQTGNLNLRTNHLDGAEAEYRRCLTLLEKLIAADPGNLNHGIQLGGCLCNLGNVESFRGDATAALAWYDRAAQTLEEVRRRDNKSIIAQVFLRNVQLGRSGALCHLGRFAEGLDAVERALVLDDGSEKPRVLMQRQAVMQGLLARWQEALEAQQEAEVLALAERLAKAASMSSEQAWEAAKLCARALAENPGDIADRFAALGVIFLTKAHQAEYFKKPANLDALHTSPELAPLRARPEFQKWVEEKKLKAKSG